MASGVSDGGPKRIDDNQGGQRRTEEERGLRRTESLKS